MKNVINTLILKLEEKLKKIPKVVINTSTIDKLKDNKINKKYKLQKESILKDNIEIIETPKLIRESSEIILPNIKDIIVDIVKEFLNTILNKVDNNILQILFNNLEKLEILNNFDFIEFKNNIFNCFFNKYYIIGYYMGEFNSINIISPFEFNIYENLLNVGAKKMVKPNYKEYMKESLFHELLHMSSTICYKEKEVEFSGFSQISLNTENIIGIGLTEGYTSYLVDKLFLDKTNKKSYLYHKNISKLLETIIGSDVMMKYYFQANLLGLLEELSKYISMEEAKSFIINLDEMLKILSKNIKKNDIGYLEKLNNEINHFIMKLNINKNKLDNKSELSEISTKLLNHALYINTRENLPKEVTYKNYADFSIENDFKNYITINKK